MSDSKVIQVILEEFSGIDYVFVFGSYANGMIRPESDVDILIGGTLDFHQRTDAASRLEIALKRRVDIVLAEQASVELLLKVFACGEPVFIKNQAHLKRDYLKCFYQADDNFNLTRIKKEFIQGRFSCGQ